MVRTLLLALPCLLLVFALPAKKTALTVPIRVRSSMHRNAAASLSSIRRRYAPSAQLDDVEPLESYQSGEFFVTGKLGIALEHLPDFNMLLDTGYPNVWVFDKSCKKCVAENKYSCSDSFTCTQTHKNFTINDEGRPANGIVYRDSYCFFMGTCTNYLQEFAAATSDPTLSGFELDGVFGASFNSISVPMPSPFKQIFEQIGCSSELFALWMDRSNAGANVGGEIHICETVRNSYTWPITYAPLKAKDYWRIGINSIAIGSNHFADAFDAIVDTGTLFMVGPSDQVAKLQQAIGAKYIGNGEYQVDCNQLAPFPDIVVNIGGTDFVLKGVDYVTQVLQNGNKICITGIVGMDIPPPNGPVWVLGSIFVEKFYTVFDFKNQQVGFATPVYTRT